MFPQPLLSQRTFPVQVVLAGVLPIAYGALCGLALAHSKALYGILTLISIVGGVGAGFDHSSAASGARRGALGGGLFGLGVVLVHAATGKAVSSIPHPAILLVLVTILAGIALGTIGGYFRGRIVAPAGA
jgi:hypothetical protein